MLYTISSSQPSKHLLDISLFLDDIDDDFIYLNLPAWRPGRYEVANFAKNLYQVTAESLKGEPLKVEKTSKDKWKITVGDVRSVKISYQYYANQMDGGGSVVDENQIYINFINCLLYAEDRLDKPCQVQLSIPEDFIIACGLRQDSPQSLLADSYYHLVDSPMMASPTLQHLSYTVSDHTFHLWINGDWQPETEILLADFKAFTEVQINTMGNFPCDDYHFLFQILPYKFYHGVEHYNSTVIVLGPSEDINTTEVMENLLGVSSHELFHTWNVIRIRPKEMLPYVFDRENYFATGYVAEGFTTYYGDVFLLRSKVFNKEVYFKNLNAALQRHLDNLGRFNLSLAESSHDLWLDGYANVAPNRKVSIYVKGSLVALMLDLTIRKLSNNQNCLDDLMRSLWKNFGMTNTGYTSEDIQTIAEHLAGSSLAAFFDDYVYGAKPIEAALNHLLNYIGYELKEQHNASPSESLFGFNTIQKNQTTIVNALAIGSLAEKHLSRDDELIAVDGRKINNNLDKLIEGKREIMLSLFRNHRLRHVTLQYDGTLFFQRLAIVQQKTTFGQEKHNFKVWSRHEW